MTSCFKVILQEPEKIYTSGESVLGAVLLSVDEPKIFKELIINFRGSCQVIWHKSGNATSVRRPSYNHYYGEEVYFHKELLLLSHPENDIVTLARGEFQFPFSFTLPQDIPSSFTHNFGKISYCLTAIIRLPRGASTKTRKIINVVTPLMLNDDSHTLLGIDDMTHKRFTRYFLPYVSSKELIVHFRTPITGFAAGEVLKFSVELDNPSKSVQVTNIKLQLKQLLEFHSKFPRERIKRHSEIVEKSVKRGPFPGKTVEIISMKIPSVVHSHVANCQLINAKYQLVVIVGMSGYHSSIKKKYEVIIGSRTVPQREFLCSPSEILHARDETPSSSSDSFISTMSCNSHRGTVKNLNPPKFLTKFNSNHQHQSINNYPPPPSYESVMAADKKI